MGLRNFGSLIIIFLILMMVFGTQRLRTIGDDLGVAIRNFRKGMQDTLDPVDDKKDTKEGTN